MSRFGFGRRFHYMIFGTLLAVPAQVIGGDSNAVEQQPVIRVKLYNYAQVTGADLKLAKRTAARFFRRTGVEVRWSDMPVSAEAQKAFQGTGRPQGPADLSVRIVPEGQVPAWAEKTHQVAFSLLPKSGKFGTISSIYSDRVHKIARRENRPVGLVLGCVVAHELGHLLLGMRGHSGRGLMSFPITSDYLTQASSGQLAFSKAQEKRLLREAWKRIGWDAETTRLAEEVASARTPR